LEIEPITTDNIYDIKNQIDDENENISLDSDLIAFDISFRYELKNGDIVKLQPYT
jgi:hypothetical protein